MGKGVLGACPEATTEEGGLSTIGELLDLSPAAEVEKEWGLGSPNVLTLTPFYPSHEDPAQGCFVAEPLEWAANLGVSNHVIGAQPFYRQRLHAIENRFHAEWASYFSIPGNIGLPMAGEFLSRRLTSQVRTLHLSTPFDVIHAHAALPCGQAAASMSEKLGIPFVVTVHGLDAFAVKQSGGAFASWAARACEKIYRRARLVVCISEKVRAKVTERTAANTVVIYNGVDTEMFGPAAEPTSPLTILSVGNLIPIKGHVLLLRAFAEMKKRIPECRLEIVGDGPDRSALVHLAKELGISHAVSFMGRQTRQQVADAMKRCAVFALPSNYEGLGCVYLEAMACGKPAIACKGQGIDEVIVHGKNGILISPESEKELIDSLEVLLRNGEYRNELGTAARATVIGQYTLEHQAERLAAVYRECVG